MDIKDIEQAIVDRLKEKINTLKIEGFPEKPEEYVLTHSRGVILVQFFGSDFSNPITPDDIIQIEDDEFAMCISVKGLRTHTGAYGYIELVRKALTGFIITGCKPMRPRRIKFGGEEGGIWTYIFVFALKRKVTPDYEDEE